MVSIESIARTVLLECREKSISATKGLCDFTVATTRRDDKQIFFSEARLEEKEASALTAKAIAMLSSEGNPAVETMRLQANFGDLFRCIESAAVNRDTERSAAVAGGIRRVVERSGDLDGRMDFEGYNRVYQLINDLLLRTARVSSMTMKVEKDVELEVSAADCHPCGTQAP